MGALYLFVLLYFSWVIRIPQHIVFACVLSIIHSAKENCEIRECIHGAHCHLLSTKSRLGTIWMFTEYMLTKCGISAGYIHFLKWLFPVIIAVVCVRFLTLISNIKCLLGGEVVKKSTCQCRRYNRCGFDPWIRKIPWSRKWQHAPVLLPGKIPWTEEPGGLWSMGLQRVRHNWASMQACNTKLKIKKQITTKSSE